MIYVNVWCACVYVPVCVVNMSDLCECCLGVVCVCVYIPVCHGCVYDLCELCVCVCVWCLYVFICLCVSWMCVGFMWECGVCLCRC